MAIEREATPCTRHLGSEHGDMWKFVIIDFVNAGIKGNKFDPDKVWTAAIRRFKVRLLAHEERQARRMRAEVSRGRALPSKASVGKQVRLHHWWTTASVAQGVFACYAPTLRHLFDTHGVVI